MRKICAVEWTYNSMTVMTGYIYDADGNRVAKGAISSWSCDPSVNGFTTQADYVRDQAGHQLSEFVPSNGTMAWQHTNIYANGMLIATDDGTETHYYLNDWLGTRRVQTNYAGTVEQTCSSLPYGDGETCAPTPTENLFTGKERDSESGNDYFGARYYASTMGRWMSPDWSAKVEPVPYAKLDDPQSLNLYSYARNNPLRNVDLDGHCDSSANATAATRCQKLSDLHASNAYQTKLKALEGEGKDHNPILAYKDIGDGHHTVGWGHVDDSKKLGTTITKDDAQKLFDADVATNEASTRKTLESNGNHDFSQGEFDALVDLQFNGNLLNSTSSPTLMKAINAGDYDALSKNLRYTMATDSNGNRVQMGGLVDRSNAREDMVKGQY